MTTTGWLALRARIRRTDRQLRIARFLFRVFRLREVEPLPIGEYAVAFGYVERVGELAAVWRTDLTDAEVARLADAINRADHLNWSSAELAALIAGTVRAIAAGRLDATP
jgi:hypothetical protein